MCWPFYSATRHPHDAVDNELAMCAAAEACWFHQAHPVQLGIPPEAACTQGRAPLGQGKAALPVLQMSLVLSPSCASCAARVVLSNAVLYQCKGVPLSLQASPRFDSMVFKAISKQMLGGRIKVLTSGAPSGHGLAAKVLPTAGQRLA